MDSLRSQGTCASAEHTAMLNGPALPTQAILSCRRCLTPLFVTRSVMLQRTQDPAAYSYSRNLEVSHSLSLTALYASRMDSNHP